MVSINNPFYFLLLAHLFLFRRFCDSPYYVDALEHEICDQNEYDEQCQCLPHNSKDDDSSARIAYLITLHNERTLNESLTLLKSIAAPGFIVLIHIDIKFPQEKYEHSDLMTYVNDAKCNTCGANVVIESIFDAEWGQWSMLEPTIWAMEQLTENPKFKKKWDVFVNLSADSMPVYTPKIISNYFSGPLKGINFVTSSSCPTGLMPTNIDIFPKRWHKSGHYREKGDFEITYNTTYENNRREANNEMKTIILVIHFGSQWMSLTPTFVEYIVSSLKHQDSLAYQFKQDLIKKERLMADETFIPTLLAHHPTLKHTLPQLLDDGSLETMEGMTAIRFERMDENIPDAFMNVVEEQRYEVPKTYESSIDVPRPWGPYYLGIYDLGNIKKSGAIFIRKVAKELDPNIFSLLPVQEKNEIPNIQWPKEVKISQKMNWDKIKERR